MIQIDEIPLALEPSPLLSQLTHTWRQVLGPDCPSPSSTLALTNVVGGLLQLLNLDVPGTRWDLYQLESSCHRGCRKAVSIENWRSHCPEAPIPL